MKSRRLHFPAYLRNRIAKSLLQAAMLLMVCFQPLLADEHLVIGGLDGIDPYNGADEIKVGLALSGGGARGLATVGLLRAFEEKHIRVTAIAGTSIGAIVGGLYACGYSPDELEEFAHQLDFGLLLANRPARRTVFLSRREDRDRHILTIRFDGLRPQIPQALTGGQELMTLLTQLTNRANYLANEDFSRLQIPFKAVSTDVISGNAVVLSRGALAEAMRASMAFPLAFTGIERGDQLLMDGGMLYPVPSSIVRDMVDSQLLVIAVNTTSPLVDIDELTTPVDIANQVTSIMTADRLREELQKADVVISPVPDDLTSVAFDKLDSLLFCGYNAGIGMADSLRQLAIKRRGRRMLNVVKVNVHDGRADGSAPVIDPNFPSPVAYAELVDSLKSLARLSGVFEIKVELTNAGADDTSNSRIVPSAEAVILNLTVVPALHRDDVTVDIIGNTAISDSLLLASAQLGDDFVDARDIRDLVDSVLSTYWREGYDLANVRQVTLDYERQTILLEIDEAIIQRIDVRNNERTRDWLIRSYLPFSRGELYSTKTASRGLENLYGSELFDGIALDLRPVKNGSVVTIRVKEKKYTQVRLGWHWHESYNSEGFIEFLDDNVAGVGMQALLHAQYGEQRQDYHAGLKFDRIFFTYLSARLGAFYLRQDRNLYNNAGDKNGERLEERWGSELMIGQHITRLGMVSGGLKISQLEMRDRSRLTSERLGLNTVNLEAQLENFDRSPFPASGNRHYVSLELAGRLIGGDVDYTKFYASLESYYTLGDLLTFHPRISVGLSRRGLPSSEKFYMGGIHSFWGFQVDELSGDKMFLMNHEVRLKLPLRLYLSGRFDIGDVYTTTESIQAKNLRTGIGGALSLDSPIGPVEIGFGGGTSNKDQVYFRAGMTF